ncbi:hypothetical protein ABL78_5609 [Leptomonas seymouri]|uniref:Uncharacterized protein n=1 Tax=Leptomonas seymouri TaxID=5684 RepID=A0A0N0P4X2_LEPSE|nr:hypothetical protein ABL78_5609 [Leptomonas seymouri]|eukprot:KPI85327.1 hypothetical protein ABL78_5609 [Leptomonas seymouri]
MHRRLNCRCVPRSRWLATKSPRKGSLSASLFHVPSAPPYATLLAHSGSILTTSSVVTAMRGCTTTSVASSYSDAADKAQDDTATASGSDEDSAPLPHLPQDTAAVALLQSLAPASTPGEIQEMLKGTKNAHEVRQVLERVVYTHYLCFDVLNGHGFRVAVLQSLTSVAPRTGCMAEWFDCVHRFRQLGFVLTRTFAAEGFTTIRQWLSNEFHGKGRVPSILTEGTAHIRELVQWCLEDRLVFDHVLYTRTIFLLTMIVSFFDRQNLYRVSFPDNFAKRDGIVVEWVITNERCVDYDECVLQCDALVEELLEQMRHHIPSRPPFSFMYRLADYYFATDNVEKLIAVMEDAESYGMNVAESTTAKLMQLACAFNYPQVPELLLRWRVLLPQCVLATPDISRLLFYFSRSGGGLPCPHCGEPYNHRNSSVYAWLCTPPHQRQCPSLQMARVQKGELEASRELPQNADWSTQAFQLYDLSRERAIEWTATEWRGFLLCCMFSPRALEAKALLDAHFSARSMDDFLRATYIRLLRYHAPELTWPTLQEWKTHQSKMSPIALQEALLATAMIVDAAVRVAQMHEVLTLLMERDSYVMPLTRRFYERRREELTRQYAAASSSPVDPAVQAEESRLMKAVIEMQPRHVSLLDMKDSAADFVVGTRRKNVYHPSTV